jgi:gas vesicle protein
MNPEGVITLCALSAVISGVVVYLFRPDSSSELKSAQERGNALESRCIDLEKQRDDLMAETTAQHDLISQVKEAASKDQAAASEAQERVTALLAKHEPKKRSHHLSKKDGGVD